MNAPTVQNATSILAGVRIKYFVSDKHKNGGAIIEFSGIVKKYLPLTEQSL